MLSEQIPSADDLGQCVITSDGELRPAPSASSDVIDWQQLHDLAQRREREARILAKASGLFNTTLDLDEVLRRVMVMATDVLGDVCSIFLIAEGSDRMRYITYHHDPEVVVRIRSVFDSVPPTASTGIASIVLQSRQPMLLQDTDVANLPQHHRVYMDALKIRSIVSVPLIVKDRLLGVMGSAVITGKRPLDDAALSTAIGLGQQAAIAIANAQLFQELQRAQEALCDQAEQLRQALVRTVAAEEAERRRIAGELHDSVIQLAVGANYQVHGARQRLLTDQREAERRLDVAQQLIERMVSEMHQVIFDLHPAVLQELGLVPALRAYVQSWGERSTVPCELKVVGAPYRLAESAELAIYRIVQEALHNVEKHARAGHAKVSVWFRMHDVRVVVRDDGQGFKPPYPRGCSGGHIGLVSMRERAQSVGATLSITGSHSSGSQVVVSLARQ